jgi:TonB family protein
MKPSRCAQAAIVTLALASTAPLAASLVAAQLPSGLTARPSPSPPPAPQEPVRVGVNVPPPVRIKEVKPVYPAIAQAAGAQGIVIIEATIGPDGKVRDAVVKRSIPLLDAAALDAVRQWEYAPTLLNGMAVPVIMTVTVNFAMQSAGPTAAGDAMPRIRLAAFMSQVWEITPERARTLPRWTPAASPPPMSTVDAIAAAQEWLRRRDERARSFEAQNVTLGRRRQGADIDFWFYQLSLYPQGGGPMSMVVILPDGSIVEPQAASSDGPARPATPPAASQASATEPSTGAFRPGSGVTYPKLVHDVRPQYTPEALKAKISGNVVLECVVLPDGTVGSVRVVRSLDQQFGLDEAAIRAAKQYRFEPGTKDGRAVPVVVALEMTFTVK